MQLDGNVALVTGSTTGIGAAIARRMAQEGAAVVLTGRTAERGERVATEIRDAGGRAHFVVMDAGVEADIESAVAAAESEFGALHILVNNAAPVDRLHLDRPIGDASREVIESLLQVGLVGAMLAMKYGVPAIERSGGGAIVNISSNVAALGFGGAPTYTAMKGALTALTRQVAVDYAPSIRCNAISIGAVRGGDISNELQEEQPDLWNVIEKAHLLGSGEQDDIANAAIFLASSQSKWMTATVLYADGGMTGRAPFRLDEAHR